MKKLMITAAAVAMTAGAFAAPLVYDYKASAKHMYAKEVNVRFAGNTFKVYQKYVKSASLKGYLIVDADGATSQTIIADKIVNDPAFNTGAWLNGTPATTASDFGRNRAFLVVQNSKAERDVRFPKLIPAVLDAKWLDTKFRVDNAGNRVPSQTGLAEGYLYAGGDFGVATRPQLDNLYAAITERAALLPQARMIGDYAWQSIFLFGHYNMPLISTAAANFWDTIQGAIDTGANGANLPLTNAYAAGNPFFHDTWMNGAGFGKYLVNDGSFEGCCGFSVQDVATILQSLSGNLKGGLFLCTENGDVVSNGQYFKFPLDLDVWEDQFFCARIDDGTGTYCGADHDQTDLWQDGELELNTTDCISGSWSIKLRTRSIAATVTAADLNNLGLALAAGWTEDAPGLLDLVSAIKGAALNLNNRTTFSNNRNIYTYTRSQLSQAANGQLAVPLMTPAFAAYYGFLNFK